MNRDEFPLHFWKDRDIEATDVIAELVNEARQQISMISGYSKLLLESDLPDQSQEDVKIILDRTSYLESILAAGVVYSSQKKREG
ncbi:MAG: hypothetical protein AAF629_36950 [Chloroflexota bacterium]